MGGRWRIYLKLSLTANLVNRCLICELTHELVCLNVNVLFAWGCLGRLDVPSEELFSSFGSLLFEALRVILALVCLEKLVWVRACWNDHGGIR